MSFPAAQYSWRAFFVMAFILLLCYTLLGIIDRVLGKVRFLGRYQPSMQRAVDQLYRISLPVILFYLIAVFILVKPMLHGILVGLAIILGYGHLRNFLSGTLMHFQQKLNVGKYIETGGLQGMIDHLGLFGLQINSQSGVSFMAYGELMKQGYTIISGDQISRLLHLHLTTLQEESDGRINHQKRLFHLFAASPFLDRHHKPEILSHTHPDRHLKCTVLLKEEKHLPDLMQVINEWGYASEVQY